MIDVHDTRGLGVRFGLLGVSLLAMLWGFRLLLTDHAPVVFESAHEDLSYGWYVPIFSLYVVWRERREILASIGSPSIWGLLFAIPSLLIGFVGARGLQIRFEIVGFVGILASLVLALFGVKTLRRTLFPILFLLFCLPLHSFLDVITIHLRLFAVSTAYETLRALGVDIMRQGTMLASSTGSFAIDIAEPCSGMRSLFAMMALTAGYAHFTQPTSIRRAMLFACSVPIAIFGNIVRIFTIVAVAATCSPTFATGFYHDYSGYVVFLVAVSLMVACGGLISRLGDRADDGKSAVAADESSAVPKRSDLRGGVAGAILTVVAVVAMMIFQGMGTDPVLCEMPTASLGEIEGYRSEKIEPSEAELATLPSDTKFDKRMYTAADGSWFAVSLVFGGKSKSSIHRPELCLPSQGFEMSDPRTREIYGSDWRVLTLRRGGVEPLGFAYSFFNQAGFRTSSHVMRIFRDVIDRSFLARIDRWAMVTVNSSRADERELIAFLAKLQERLK